MDQDRGVGGSGDCICAAWDSILFKLHNPRGTRILGYDNAHSLKLSGYTNRKLPYDHKHRCAADLGISYEFIDAYQLLKDFFEDVDKTLSLVRDK